MPRLSSTPSTGWRSVCRNGNRSSCCIDDLHWADLASIRWLIYRARRVADHPIALVMTTRREDGARRSLLDRLAGESATVEPAPISADGVRQYLHEHLSAADDVFSSACHAACGGNPFLVTELIGAVQASGMEPVAANAGRVRTVTASKVNAQRAAASR